MPTPLYSYSKEGPIDMWKTIYPENIDLLDGYENKKKDVHLQYEKPMNYNL